MKPAEGEGADYRVIATAPSDAFFANEHIEGSDSDGWPD